MRSAVITGKSLRDQKNANFLFKIKRKDIPMMLGTYWQVFLFALSEFWPDIL